MRRRADGSVRILFASAGVIASIATFAFASERAPQVATSTRQAKSARLSDYKPAGPPPPRANREIPNETATRKAQTLSHATSDPVVQKRFGLSLPQPLADFDGASDDDNADGARIADGASRHGRRRGPQPLRPVHQWRRHGLRQVRQHRVGPLPGNAFWAGLGGPCEERNDGDPLVRYDRQADRWVVSQFALPNFPDGPFYQCFAVSTTNDPTGEYWFQYEFKTSDDFFTDYGKLGVWPDAYYMSFNMFGPSGSQGGAYAFDRSAMLVGAPAGMIVFDTGEQLGVLPSDLDGPTPPPAGSPNYFLTFDVNPARLHQWQFHVDWTTPENSTFTGPIDIPVAEFLYPVCDADRGQCVPQLESAEKLETLGDRLMYRLVYRNFGDHESLVVNHTVGTEQGSAAVRWYEIRSLGDAPVVYQQGTYAPDATFRWMGRSRWTATATSPSATRSRARRSYPSIGITGRLAAIRPGRWAPRTCGSPGRGSQEAQLEPLGRLQHDVDRSRPTTARSGTRRSTTARPAASTSRPASAPSVSRAARAAPRASSRAR